MTAWPAVVLLTLTGGTGTPLVSEDFESGGFDGGWYVTGQLAGVTVDPSQAAAHRGSWGARCVDAEAPGNLVNATVAERRFPTPGPDLYYRVWFRMTQWNGRGGTSVFGLYGRDGAQGATYNSVGTDYQSAIFQVVQPLDDAGVVGYEAVPTSFQLADAGWVLLEGASWGIGTWDFESVLLAQGAELARVRGSTMPTSGDSWVAIGDHFQHSGPGFQAVMDFDDVWVSDVPLPGRLSVAQASNLVEGGCATLAAQLRSNVHLRDGGDPGPILAPYDVTVQVDAGGVAFADGACSVPLASLTITQGTTKRLFHVRPLEAGRLSVDLTQGPGAPDFLAGGATFAVLPADGGTGPDGGTGFGPLRLGVGCGCGAAPAQGGLAALLLLALRARRRSAR